MRYIDKLPPTMTGNTREDVQSIASYLLYLQEQINFILSAMDRKSQDAAEQTRGGDTLTGG